MLLERREAVVKTLVSEKLDKIIEGAKTASDAIGTDSNLIANVSDGSGSTAGVKGETEDLVKGIKSIVDNST